MAGFDSTGDTFGEPRGDRGPHCLNDHDPGAYDPVCARQGTLPEGDQVSDQEIDALSLVREDFHGE